MSSNNPFRALIYLDDFGEDSIGRPAPHPLEPKQRRHVAVLVIEHAGRPEHLEQEARHIATKLRLRRWQIASAHRGPSTILQPDGQHHSERWTLVITQHTETGGGPSLLPLLRELRKPCQRTATCPGENDGYRLTAPRVTALSYPNPDTTTWVEDMYDQLAGADDPHAVFRDHIGRYGYSEAHTTDPFCALTPLGDLLTQADQVLESNTERPHQTASRRVYRLLLEASTAAHPQETAARAVAARLLDIYDQLDAPLAELVPQLTGA